MRISRFRLPGLKGLYLSGVVVALLLVSSACKANSQAEVTNVPGGVALAGAPNPTSTEASPTSVPVPSVTAHSTATSIPTPVMPSDTPAPTDSPAPVQSSASAWKTWQSAQGGYQVEYPANWTVQEQASPQGRVTTTFLPPGQQVGVTIVVTPGAEEPPNNDIPNRRCRPITIDSIRGTQCFDTISFSSSVTLQSQGRTFMIGIGKFLKEDVSNHFFSSFRLLR